MAVLVELLIKQFSLFPKYLEQEGHPVCATWLSLTCCCGGQCRCLCVSGDSEEWRPRTETDPDTWPKLELTATLASWKKEQGLLSASKPPASASTSDKMFKKMLVIVMVFELNWKRQMSLQWQQCMMTQISRFGSRSSKTQTPQKAVGNRLWSSSLCEHDCH